MKANTIAMVALLAAWVAGPAGGEVGSEGRVEMAPVALEPPAAPTAPTARVARATFTTGVVDREPQDSIRSLSNDNVEIFFFSEIRDGSGATIIHRWEWNGQMMAEVPFEVGGPRWRIFSSKTLDPSWLGEWTVLLVDAAGQVLSRESF
ncbi:MAG: DUF2914 domain-containing protein, partial [Myxococcota bacterium]